MHKQLLLDVAYLETTIQSTAVYFRAHTGKSTFHHLLRCHKRISKHRERATNNIFLDEAHFNLGGYVNKQNCRFWGTENHAHIH